MTTTQPTGEQIRDAWDTLATRFDDHVTPMTQRLGEDLLNRIDLGPGSRFLDVGAGSGALSLPAARRGAQVLATDIAPTMIERLERRATSEGLTNLRCGVMDGQSLDLEDDSFDVSASLNGVSLFPDVDSGISELARVTKPGGQVLVAAFGAPRKVEFVAFFFDAIRAAVPDAPVPPMDPPPLPFQLADPAVFHRKLTAAGLTDVTVETPTRDMPFESAAQFWDMVTSSNPIAVQLVRSLSAEQLSEAQRVADGMLRERSGGEPSAVLHAELSIGIGRA